MGDAPPSPDAGPEEQVDVVDRHDVVLRTVPRSVMRRERLLHRAVYVAVFRPDGALLIHRRSETKDIWPGRWDIAVGGVVAAGESWDEAVRREIAEEIGVDDVVPEQIGAGSYEDAELAVLGRCYRIVTAAALTFTDGEVIEAEWVESAALPTLVRKRPFLPDGLALLGPFLGVR